MGKYDKNISQTIINLWKELLKQLLKMVNCSLVNIQKITIYKKKKKLIASCED